MFANISAIDPDPRAANTGSCAPPPFHTPHVAVPGSRQRGQACSMQLFVRAPGGALVTSPSTATTVRDVALAACRAEQLPAAVADSLLVSTTGGAALAPHKPLLACGVVDGQCLEVRFRLLGGSDAAAKETIVVRAVTQKDEASKFVPGALYNARTEKFVAGNAFRGSGTEAFKSSLDVREGSGKDFIDMVSERSSKERADRLDLSLSLRMEYMGGTIKVGGRGTYLKDDKDNYKKQRVTYVWQRLGTTVEVPESMLSNANEVFVDRIKNPDAEATHFVQHVQYGADVNMLFEYEVSSRDEFNKIGGELDVQMAGMAEGAGNVDTAQSLKVNHERIKVRFEGNVRLNSGVLSYEAAMQTFKVLPEVMLTEHPMVVTLAPIASYVPRAAKLAHAIGDQLVSRCEEEFGRVEQQVEALSWLADQPELDACILKLRKDEL